MTTPIRAVFSARSEASEASSNASGAAGAPDGAGFAPVLAQILPDVRASVSAPVRGPRTSDGAGRMGLVAGSLNRRFGAGFSVADAAQRSLASRGEAKAPGPEASSPLTQPGQEPSVRALGSSGEGRGGVSDGAAPAARAGGPSAGDSSGGDAEVIADRRVAHRGQTAAAPAGGERGPAGSKPVFKVETVEPVSYGGAADAERASLAGGVAVTAPAGAGGSGAAGPFAGSAGPAAVSGVSSSASANARGTGGAAPPQTPTPPRAQGQAVADQVAKGMTGLLKNGGTMTLKLAPEALGAVRVEVSLRDGVVSARFQAERASARELLSGHLDTLRSALETRGVRVEHLEVEAHREQPWTAAGDEAGRKARFGGAESRSGGDPGAGDGSGEHAGGSARDGSAGDGRGGAHGRAGDGSHRGSDHAAGGDGAGSATERTVDAAEGSEIQLRLRVDVVA